METLVSLGFDRFAALNVIREDVAEYDTRFVQIVNEVARKKNLLLIQVTRENFRKSTANSCAKILRFAIVSNKNPASRFATYIYIRKKIANCDLFAQQVSATISIFSHFLCKGANVKGPFHPYPSTLTPYPTWVKRPSVIQSIDVPFTMMYHSDTLAINLANFVFETAYKTRG